MKKTRILALLMALMLVFTVQALVETTETPALTSDNTAAPSLGERISQIAAPLAELDLASAPYEQAYNTTLTAMQEVAALKGGTQTALEDEDQAALDKLFENVAAAWKALGKRAVETQGTTFDMFAEDGAFLGDGGQPAAPAAPESLEDYAARAKAEAELLAERKGLYFALYNDDVKHIPIRVSTARGVLASAGFPTHEELRVNHVPVGLISRMNGTALLSAETLIRVKQAQWLLQNKGMLAKETLVDYKTLLNKGLELDGQLLSELPKMVHNDVFQESFLVHHPADGYYRLDVIGIHAPTPPPVVVPVAPPAAPVTPPVVEAPPVEKPVEEPPTEEPAEENPVEEPGPGEGPDVPQP